MSDPFNPRDHLTKLKGKDYLEVKWRLVWLRDEHPDAVISTELVAHDLERRWCMFRALVAIPDGGSATGYGQEDAAGFAGNPGDYPEKAETKALGRALAALGYGTQFTEDFDFDADARRVVDSPVERTTPQTNGASAMVMELLTQHGATPVNPAAERAAFAARAAAAGTGAAPQKNGVHGLTEKQRNAIFAISKGRLGRDATATDLLAKEQYGTTVELLSLSQASEFIGKLQTGVFD